ncbi:MAG: hypothetical protein J6Y01_08015 [Spirochaetales bacterium]|nr:hypothetical protein [Spirochaetales bacterium]
MKKFIHVLLIVLSLFAFIGCVGKTDMTFYGINDNETILIAVIPEQPPEYRMITLRIDSRDLGDYRNMRLTQHGKQLMTSDGDLCLVKSGDDLTEIRRAIKYNRTYTPLTADEMKERLTKLLEDYKTNAEKWLVYDYAIQIELVNGILEKL